jgi:hypothetical protein
MLLSLLAGLALKQSVSHPDFDFFRAGPYEAGISNPEKTLGYALGSKHTVFRDQEKVVLGIAEKAKARVKVIDYGTSVEGRPLRVLAISSPENIARLEAIRQDIQKLAFGEGDTEAIIRRSPAIVWVNECIHGDETASFESGMALIYNLAASKHPRIQKILKDAVVIVNPVYNPDGHERYVVWYNSVAVGSAKNNAFEVDVPSSSRGRHNHYRFDMNRDRIALSQDETRQEIKEYFRWWPQVYADQHGQVDTFFMPPTALSTNFNVDLERYNKWTDIFGRSTAKSFDTEGFLYFIKGTYDFFALGFLDSWATMSGSIGMTHETDGGRTINRTRADGSILTLRDGIAKHFTAALAVAEAASTRREDLLRSFSTFKKKAISGESAGEFRRVIVTGHPARLRRLQAQLKLHMIKSAFANESFTQNATDYYTGKLDKKEFPQFSLVIDIAQPQAHLAKALLEVDAKFEEEFIKKQVALQKAEGAIPYDGDYDGFYDITGWSLPFLHSLSAWWSSETPKLNLIDELGSEARAPGKSTIGYAIPYDDESDILVATKAMQAGVRGMLNPRLMKLGGLTFQRGAFLFLAERNDADYASKLYAAGKGLNANIVPLDTAYPDEGKSSPGWEDNLMIRKPNIAVVFGKGGNIASVSGIWFLLEREWKLPFTPITTDALNRDLSEYSTVVVPSGAGVSVTPKLREFVQGGGSLVVLENPGWALGSSGFGNLDTQSAEERLTMTLFQGELDPRSFLGFGYPIRDGKIRLAVPVSGSTYYKAKKDESSAIRIVNDGKKLSGWVWEGDTEKAVAGTVFCQTFSAGSGSVTLFTNDPTDRVMYPGLWQLVLNAMILGARP